MDERPQPDGRHVPDGCELVAVPDKSLSWRIDVGRRCRGGSSPGKKACGRPSVAALNRSRWTGRVKRESWWAYCADHMYGRWIEDGVIMCWVLREKAAGDG